MDERDSYILNDEFLGRTILKSLMSSEKTILMCLVALRVVNAFVVQTYFVPDEYWQSVEVAHKVVFGYGYMTWEWTNGIRGFIYPTMFAVLYKLLAILHLDYRILIIKLPHVLQAVISAYGDLYLYKLVKKLNGRPTAQWAILSQVLSWFTLYMSTRTLSNSTEAALTIVALYHYPWPGKHNTRGSWRFILVAAVSVVMRPTAAIIWVLLCSWHLQRNLHNVGRVLLVYVVIGFSVLLSSTLLDCLFYGRQVWTLYNFMEFNLLSGHSSLFGVHSWHWYFTQGFPAILFTHAYPFIRGVWISRNKVPLVIIVWTLFFYSLLAHKEFRFIYPILPLCMYYCGVYFESLTSEKLKSDDLSNDDEILSTNKDKVIDTNKVNAQNVNDDVSNENKEQDSSQDSKTSGNKTITHTDNHEKLKKNRWKAKILVILLALSNIPSALYFCLIHQRGTITVMHYLARQGDHHPDMSVLFLTPCHSTPYYSYIHKNISMRFLACEPNFQRDANYTDETDLFFADPLPWLESNVFNHNLSLPTHIVYYDSISKSVTSKLSQNNYTRCAKFFHTHITQGRVGRHVEVSCYK